jgi:WD40 repeat protein
MVVSAPDAVLRHSGITSAAFIRDAQRVVTASRDGSIQFWTRNCSLLFQDTIVRGHRASITSVDVSPDGTRVVTASEDGTARLWSVAMEAQSLQFGDPPFAVNISCFGASNSAHFSPDGARILLSRDDAATQGVAGIRDATTGKLQATLEDSSYDTRAYTFSRDGSRILGLSHSLEMRTRTNVTTGERGVEAVATGPKVGQVWDSSTGKRRFMFGEGRSDLRNASFSRDGTRIVTGSGDGLATVWDAATGERLVVIKGPPDSAIDSVQLSRDGKRIVTTTDDATTRVWDAKDGRQLMALTCKGGFSSSVFAAFSADDARIITEGVTAACAWDSATGRTLVRLTGPGGPAVHFLDDREFATVSDKSVKGSSLRFFDLTTGAQFAELLDGGWFVGLTPDRKRVLTHSSTAYFSLWDAVSGEPILQIGAPTDDLTRTEFSSDGKRIATVSNDDTVRVWALPPRCQELIDQGRSRIAAGDLGLSDEERKAYFLDERPDGLKGAFALILSLLSRILPPTGDSCL